MIRTSFAKRLPLIVCAALLASLAPAQNDSCATAIPLVAGLTAGNNLAASTGPDPSGSCGGMMNDVWYSYTAPCTGTAVMAFCGSGSATYDTVLAAWSGTCGALAEIACNDDTCSLQSQITFPVQAGVTYYVSVGGFFGAQGSFTLLASCNTATSNDACAGAVTVTEGVPTPSSNIGATTGPEPSGSCGAMANDVWFVITPSCSGAYTATTCDPGTSYDTVVAIWDGSGGCGGLVQLACNDDNCSLSGNGLNSTVTWTATAGATYYISVGGFFGASGLFTLTVNSGGGLGLNFTNSGFGTLGYQVTGAPPFGSQFTAVTLNAGAFPNGWFYGVDIPFSELISEVNFGFPFLTGVAACGDATVGPFFGLPSGLTVYGVTLAFPVGSQNWTAVSPAASGTVP